MQYPCYEITLPMPTSINAAHTVGMGFRDPKTKKWRRTVPRSDQYNLWIDKAGVAFRNQFPQGVWEKFTGRLRVDYIFIWNKDEKAAAIASDISNREKCLTDFLEGKFFLNDNQIDEQHHFRRIVDLGVSRVMLRIYEIPDRRFDDPAFIFNPTEKGK